MTALTDSRKRSREEDGSDFMPLSKRITNLNINNTSSMDSEIDTDYNMNLNQQQQQQTSAPHQHQSLHQRETLQFQNQNQFGLFVQSNDETNHFSELSNGSHSIDVQERQYHQYLSECNNGSSSNGSSCTTVSSNDNVNHVGPYEPELSQEENPYYYSKNKLLYDLYLERMRRQQ